jgi:hypothetical protein
MMLHKQGKGRSEQGSALIYILIAIALLALLTVTFMEPSSQQTSSQNTFKTTTALQGQADMIRASIQECVLSYPKGDRCINGDVGNGLCAAAPTTDPDARENYPINPDSTHYTSATPGPAGDMTVKSIRCPGNNEGGANFANHEPVFGGSGGKFLPPAPDMFQDWQYYNGTDGVFFWTQTNKTDAFLVTALTKLDEKYAECEADVIDNISGGSAMDIDSTSAAGIECPANSLCFRVWMIANTADNIYPGDTDGDEGAGGANCP